jgi:hypothetical protein
VPASPAVPTLSAPPLVLLLSLALARRATALVTTMVLNAAVCFLRSLAIFLDYFQRSTIAL